MFNSEYPFLFFFFRLIGKKLCFCLFFSHSDCEGWNVKIICLLCLKKKKVVRKGKKERKGKEKDLFTVN